MQNPILQKLLSDGLAIMTPDDPARPALNAAQFASADESADRFSIYFNSFGEDTRCVRGHGTSPEEALADFAARYSPRGSRSAKIAALEKELAELKGLS
jgi:hypothetical protein